MSVLRDQILASDDIAREVVEIPEWGDVKVELHSLDVESFTALGRAAKGSDGELDLRETYLAMLVQGVYDPDTQEPVFTDADKPALATRSMKVVERLTGRLNELSGMNARGDVNKAVDAEGKGYSATTGA